AQEKSMGTSQPVAQPQPAAQQPVVVVPPVVQTQAEQQENAQTAQARFLRRNNPFAANRFAEGNDD
ncbi:MAG: hypothetical protein K2K12_00760, partial [Clostridia bacterium]|nr:hypothetical protein [Clostridia bacterium]